MIFGEKPAVEFINSTAGFSLKIIIFVARNTYKNKCDKIESVPSGLSEGEYLLQEISWYFVFAENSFAFKETSLTISLLKEIIQMGFVWIHSIRFVWVGFA